MPVVLQVGAVLRRLEAQERRQIVSINTRQRPGAVVLDPDFVLIDIDPANNRKVLR
ncbi:MAG: hypothetical protein ACRENP_04780 [Longimicrobiales bacterium]